MFLSPQSSKDGHQIEEATIYQGRGERKDGGLEDQMVGARIKRNSGLVCDDRDGS